jgi:hypothetical protein
VDLPGVEREGLAVEVYEDAAGGVGVDRDGVVVGADAGLAGTDGQVVVTQEAPETSSGGAALASFAREQSFRDQPGKERSM